MFNYLQKNRHLHLVATVLFLALLAIAFLYFFPRTFASVATDQNTVNEQMTEAAAYYQILSMNLTQLYSYVGVYNSLVEHNLIETNTGTKADPFAQTVAHMIAYHENLIAIAENHQAAIEEMQRIEIQSHPTIYSASNQTGNGNGTGIDDGGTLGPNDPGTDGSGANDGTAGGTGAHGDVDNCCVEIGDLDIDGVSDGDDGSDGDDE